jgi:hypothetical protein
MNTYKRHRFPPDIISYAVWLHYRFNISHRDSEIYLPSEASQSAASGPSLVYQIWSDIRP